MAKSKKKSTQQTELHLNFGKKLAHTDKVVRDRGFRILKTWLQKNTQLDRLEYRKLWKGLYFAFWMSDKRPVQQELAVNIALLLNDVPRSKRSMWLDCFWETMQTHWEQLDKHRMSKYQLLTRIVVAEMFKSLREGGWEEAETRAIGATFTGAVPHSAQDGINTTSTGLLLHLLRSFWDELSPQLDQEPKASKDVIMLLLEPFCVLAEGSFLGSLVKHIHEQILRRAPPEILAVLVTRVLDGAAKAEVPKANRQALYETADALEKGCRPSEASKLTLPPLAMDPTSPRGPRAGKTSRRERKRQRLGVAAGGAGGEGDCNTGASVISPLMLPKAAVTLDGSAAKKKVKRRGGKRVAIQASTEHVLEAKEGGQMPGAEAATVAPPRNKRKRALSGTVCEQAVDVGFPEKTRKKEV